VDVGDEEKLVPDWPEKVGAGWVNMFHPVVVPRAWLTAFAEPRADNGVVLLYWPREVTSCDVLAWGADTYKVGCGCSTAVLPEDNGASLKLPAASPICGGGKCIN